MENKTLKNWLKDNSISTLIIVFLTILFGIFLSELQNKLGWSGLTLSLLFISSIIFFILWLSFKNVLSINQSIADRIESNCNNLIDRYKLDWILSSEQIENFEKELCNIEIWLITSDLAEDTVGSFFQECVSKNLKKNSVIYKYFVPDTLDIKAKVEKLKLINNNHENLHFIFLSDDFFFLTPRLDFSIYNPFQTPNSMERLGLMGIPDTDEEIQYHAKVSDLIIDTLIGKLLKFIEN